jgi:hypothetical protein
MQNFLGLQSGEGGGLLLSTCRLTTLERGEDHGRLKVKYDLAQLTFLTLT